MASVALLLIIPRQPELLTQLIELLLLQLGHRHAAPALTGLPQSRENQFQTGQVLLAEGSALHQRLVYQVVDPYPPQGDRAFLSEHDSVMLVQEGELNRYFATAIQGFAWWLINSDSLVGDLPNASGIACLLVNDLLQPQARTCASTGESPYPCCSSIWIACNGDLSSSRFAFC
jgi:hypothetical protein